MPRELMHFVDRSHLEPGRDQHDRRILDRKMFG